jgi:hypothetical protein
MIEASNVIGTALQPCGLDPKTGFYRDGLCSTDAQDRGLHTVCAVVSDEFLEYSRAQGNDLVTPIPAFDFPGLKAGDRWCLCASRWKEAYLAGVAPQVVLNATHGKTLEIIDLDALLEFAVDIPSNA